MASTASSRRPPPPPIRTVSSTPTRKPPPIPPPSLTLSRSQQLANAIAVAEAQMKDAVDQSQKQHISPSLQQQQQQKMEVNQSDVIWQGKGASLLERGLPSPGNHTSNEDSQGEFADADEGFDSDEARSVDDNTTFTTLSTSGSTTKRSTSNAIPPIPSPSLQSATFNHTAPGRPQRKAPRNPQPIVNEKELEDDDDSGDDDDDDLDAGTTYGHASRSSIGSSIWAGRGKKKNFTEDTDIPALPSPDLTTLMNRGIPKIRKDRISMAETSSIYSQGGATDWNDEAHQHAFEQTPPLDKLRQFGTQISPQSRDDEFEMMDTQSVYEGRNSISSNYAGLTSPTFAPNTAEPERRLPDGTLVPKMPPLPPHHYSPDPNANTNSIQKRGKKGRRNRSPVLSYADGEEEEERLVQERELREHGGLGGLQTNATGMGPKLKKNSPAPWEMDNDLDLDGSGSVGGGSSSTGAKRSTDGPYLSSRPSMEHLFAAGMKNPSNWARQSMEQFRNRSVSNGSTPSPMPPVHTNHPGASNISLPSSKSTAAFPSNPSNTIGQASSPLAGMPKGANWLDDEPTSQMENSSTGDDAPSRRSRTKSISGSAAGMLKGLGLASSAAPAKKASSSRLAKAFQRGNKNGPQGTLLQTESSRKQSLNLSRGISSDDYAHLPPSPTLNQNNINLQVANGSSPYMSHSSANSHSSLSHRSEGSPGLANFVPSTNVVPPMPKRTTSNGASAQSTTSANQSSSAIHTSSADGHSLTGSSSSHNLQQKLNGGLHRAEMMDMIMSSNAKARETHARNPTEGSATGSADTGADATSPQRSTFNVQKASPNNKKANSQEPGSTSPKHPIPYKSTLGFGNGAERTPAGVPHQQSFKPQPAGPMRGKGLTSGPEGDLHANESIDSQRSGENKAINNAKPTEAALNSLPKLPSVGAHDGVPYKLISLEEARLQQQRANQSSDPGAGLPTSNSEKSLGLNLNSADPGERERSLKNKKSGGFLRRFGKEKSDNNPDNFGPMPSFANANHQQNVFQQGDSVAVQAPPTLSVRPMSSMFSGFAPGFIDTLAATEEGDEDAERQQENSDPNGFLSPSNAVKRTLAPHSPAITVASVDSGTSGADYYDAQDGIASSTTTTLKAPSSNLNGATLRAPTSAIANVNSPTFVAHMSSRPSTDSNQSDNSSALGLVNGFPNLPTTGHGATAASLTGKDRNEGTGGAMTNSPNPSANANADGISSLASATRSRALEIEAKMTELHAELVKLRVFAIDSGLAKPVQQITSPELGNNDTFDPELSEKELAQQEDALLIPIDPCSHCGCHCAEQKRLQSLNELAILKGISVLDRGRALKPLAGQNGSKFGGYLDR